LAIVTNVGTGCGGRGSVKRVMGSQGGSPGISVSGRSAQDEWRCSGRQNRVVLASVADAKSAEARRPDRA